jgi:hypothetical protein
MDEMTLIRDLADDTPLPDLAQLTDVRAKLMTEIAPRRRRKFRLVVPTVGVAAAAAVVLVVGLSGTPRGPDAAQTPPTVQAPKVLTAAAVLDYAAEGALREPVVAPRPDQYLYLKIVSPGGYQERWTAVDGKRPGYTLNTDPNVAIPTAPMPACGTGAVRLGRCVVASHYVAANPRTVEETMRFVIGRERPGAAVNETNFFKPAIGLMVDDLLSPQLKAISPA